MENPYKNIIIFGRSRAGKSTLAAKISSNLPYQILRADPMRDSFANCFKGLNIKIDTAIHNQEYQFFLYDYLCRMVYEARENWGYVLEGFEISIDMIEKYFLNQNSLVYCLGTLDMDPKEFAENVHKNDTQYDWTYNMSQKQLLEFAKGELEASKKLQEECEKRLIPFYNTAYNREKVLNLIKEDVVKKYRNSIK